MIDNLRDFIDNKFSSFLIYEEDDGYVLYEKYKIQKNTQGYTTHRYTDGSTREFSKLRTAASWAILDRYNKIVEARRLCELDGSISSLAAEIMVHKKLQRSKNLETREINRDKYLVAIDKQKRFQWELDKYIILAKKCQDKGYENELTRTSRK